MHYPFAIEEAPDDDVESSPTVSVITPTYNRAEILSSAVESVLGQTLSDFEYIIVDDASTDDTHDVVAGYDDSRINYVRHDENRGPNEARNTGLRHATSGYIAFLDDDDRWKPSKLAKQIEKFEESSENVGLVYTGREVYDGDEVVTVYEPTIGGDVFHELLLNNFIPSETPLVKRCCFEMVGGFDPRLESSQDWDMWLRIARHFDIAYVDDVLAESDFGTLGRISDDACKKCQGNVVILQKYARDFVSRPRSLAFESLRILKYCSLSLLHGILDTERD